MISPHGLTRVHGGVRHLIDHLNAAQLVFAAALHGKGQRFAIEGDAPI